MEDNGNKSDERSPETVGNVIEKQTVKILDVSNGTALIEWIKDNVIFRGYLPAKKLFGKEAEVKDLKKALKYGDDLKVTFDTISPEQLEQELNRHGIWKVSDVEKNLSMVSGIILRLAQAQAVNYLKKLRGEK